MSDEITNAAPTEAAPQESVETSQEGSLENQESTEQSTSTEQKLKETKQENKEEPKSSKKKLKIKVDSKEEEIEFDPNDDEFLKKQLQLAKASQKRFQEYAQLEKEVKEFIDTLKKNPRKVLSDPTIGIDIKDLAKQIIEEEIENMQKSPEQIEREKLEQELKSLKEEREREKEELKTKEMERLLEQEFDRYDREVTKALESSDLPRSPYVVKKMADYMLLGLQNGYGVSPEEVLPLIRDEIINDVKDMFGVMPEEVIESIIGKDTISKLRKRSIAKAKQAPVTAQQINKDVGISNNKEKAEKSQDKLSYKDFFKL